MASVEAELQDVPGTNRIDVDLKNQSVTVVFDPTRTNVDALRAAIGQAGYTPKSETIIEH